MFSGINSYATAFLSSLNIHFLITKCQINFNTTNIGRACLKENCVEGQTMYSLIVSCQIWPGNSGIGNQNPKFKKGGRRLLYQREREREIERERE